jgi:hypothetical protein
VRDRISVGRGAAAVVAALLSFAGVLGLGSSAGTMAGRGLAQAAGSSVPSIAPGASGRHNGTRPKADAHSVRHGRAETVARASGPVVSHTASAHAPVPGIVAATCLPPAARQSINIRPAFIQTVAGVPPGAVPGRAPPHLTGS